MGGRWPFFIVSAARELCACRFVGKLARIAAGGLARGVAGSAAWPTL